MPALKNPRHELFAQLMARGKGTQVENYVKAGYRASAEPRQKGGQSPASVCAAKLLGNASVRARVSELQARVAKRLEFDAVDVLRELAKIGFSDMGNYMKLGADGDPRLDFSELTPDHTAALQEVTVDTYMDGRGEDAREVKRVKFKLADKRAALVDLGKHFGAFNADKSGGKNPHDDDGNGPQLTIKIVGGLPQEPADDEVEDKPKG